MTDTTARRRLPAWCAVLLVACCLLPRASAQTRPGEGFEEFEEVDPYTKGEREALDRLGYVSLGVFRWQGAQFTKDVQEALGGTDMLWVETEHFKIGSSLTTYAFAPDADEKKLLAAELERLEKKTGRWRGKKKELDPWLRLHLYAQRAEELYASFCADFGLAPSDFEPKKRILGQEHKIKLLVCERESELSRYIALNYPGYEQYEFLGRVTPEAGLFFGTSVEALRANWTKPEEQPIDTMLHCQVVAGLAAVFLEGFRNTYYVAPTWLPFAAGHVYVRRIDPRWVSSCGHSPDAFRREDDWKWERDVYSLVSNEFFASTETMFGWTGYDDMKMRDHMVAWAKLEYLLTVAEGDRKSFLMTLVTRGPEKDEKEERLARQRRALSTAFRLTPEQFDEQWAAWVSKNWRRK